MANSILLKRLPLFFAMDSSVLVKNMNNENILFWLSAYDLILHKSLPIAPHYINKLIATSMNDR